MSNPILSTQNPNAPMYQFIDTQPNNPYPVDRNNSPSHITTRQQTPSAITAALPIVVTQANHGYVNGQTVRATKFITIPFALATGMEQLNNLLFYVWECSTNTFVLGDANGNFIDGRLFTPYVQGGQFTLTGTSLAIVNPSHFPPPGYPAFPPP
jgi:hypothetical protein